MGFELLREADYILNACGRPTPPPGYKFVDLPRQIAYSFTFTFPPESTPNVTSSSQRVQNKANTLFLVEGISLSGAQFRIKWPSGRSFSQDQFVSDFPAGSGARMYKLPAPEPVPADGRITIEVFTSGATIEFWGKLRYLVIDRGPRKGAICTVQGYPREAQEQTAGDIITIPNPVTALQNIPQYQSCAPNGNIMAPEFRLGNQCTPETPDGYRDESFTFRSPAVSLAQNAFSVSNPVAVIPGNDLVVLRRFRMLNTFTEDADAQVSFAIRTPSGFSYSGGDLCSYSQGWYYFFPEWVLGAGERLIMDVGNYDGSAPGDGLITSFSNSME